MDDTAKTVALIKAIGLDAGLVEQKVDAWLDEHPEATTTVQDGSITKQKLDQNLQSTVDDVGDLKSNVGNIYENQLKAPVIEVYNNNWAGTGTVNSDRHTQVFKTSDIVKVILHPRSTGNISVALLDKVDDEYSYVTYKTLSNGTVSSDTDLTSRFFELVTTDYVCFQLYTSNQDVLNNFKNLITVYVNTKLNSRITDVENGELNSFVGLNKVAKFVNHVYPLLEHPGLILSNGGIQETQNREILQRYSDLIPVKAGEQYTFNGFVGTELDSNVWKCYCFYGSDGSPVGSRVVVTTGNGTFNNGYIPFKCEIDIPSDGTVKYIRVCSHTYGDAYFAITAGDTDIVSLDNLVAQYHETESLKTYADTGIETFYNNNGLVNFLESTANVVSIAHRGYTAGGAAENTIPAFLAAKANGFLRIETDVRATSDGVLVCLHDTTIDRTSDGTGNISSMTYAEASAYNYGTEKYPATIPKFTDYLDVCKKTGIKPYIEIKNQSLIPAIIASVKDYGLCNAATWIANSMDALDTVLSALPNARIEILGIDDSIITWAQQKISNGVEVIFYASNFASITAAQLEAIKNSGIIINVSASSETQILSINPYVSEVTTDNKLASVVLYNSALST